MSVLFCILTELKTVLAGKYLFSVNNRNTRTRREVCSELTIKRSLIEEKPLGHYALNG